MCYGLVSFGLDWVHGLVLNLVTVLIRIFSKFWFELSILIVDLDGMIFKYEFTWREKHDSESHILGSWYLLVIDCLLLYVQGRTWFLVLDIVMTRKVIFRNSFN